MQLFTITFSVNSVNVVLVLHFFSIGVQTVSFKDWEKIDSAESLNGEKVGKPREKIVDVSEMMKLAS